MLRLRPLLRALVLWLPMLVVAALLHSAPALAQARSSSAQADLEAAEKAFTALDYDTANAAAARLLKSGGLSHDQVVRAQRVLTLSHGALGHDADAKEAAIVLLAYDPDFHLDPDEGAKVQLPVLEARGYWKAQPSAPGLETSLLLPSDESGTLRVVVRDPLHNVVRIVGSYRWGSAGSFVSQNVAATGGAAIEVPKAPPGTARLDYYVQAFDAHDNVVFESGNPDSPKSRMIDQRALDARPRAPESRSLFASPWFWIVGGALVAGGVTTAVVATSSPAPTTVTLPADKASLGAVMRCGATLCP